MLKASVATVHIANARAGVERATYGQQTMWGFAANMGADAYHLNLFQVVPVPTGTSTDTVLAALRDLVLRHESLRTRLRPDADGALCQHLAAADDMTVEVWDTDEIPDEAALAETGQQAETYLTRTLFRLDTDWPFRALLGCVLGQPVAVMMVVSHVAADHMSTRIVADDLAALLGASAAGEPAPGLPPRWQPLDLAGFEHSALGQRRLARTMADWQRRLATAPRTMFPIHPVQPQPLQFWRGALRSPAAAAAVAMLGARYNVSTLTVLLAAQAVLLGHNAGVDRCAIEVMLPNRMRPELRWAVGNLTQTSLVVIDLHEATFPALIRRTWSEWVHAGTTSHYNFAGLRALRRDLEHTRGIGFDLECFFNDVRPVTQAESPDWLTAEQLRKLAEDSTFEWIERLESENNKFFLRVAGDPDVLEISALVDTAFLPPDLTRAILVGMERLLVWQATATDAEAEMALTPAVLAEITSLPAQAPAPGWVLVDRVPVHVATVADLVALAADGRVAATAVEVRAGADGVQLIGYLAGGDAGSITPEEIHQRCTAALVNPLLPEPQWLCAITPHHYVICAEPPVGSGQGSAPDAGWDRCLVLREGSGRRVAGTA